MKAEDLTAQIKQAQAGDSEAFAQIYDAYAQKLFRYIRLKVRSRQQAEDLLQEVFVKIWRGLPGYQSDKGSFNSWAYRVAANALNDFFRKTYRAPEALEMSEEVEYEASFWQTESLPAEKLLDMELAVGELKQTLAALPDDYRRVLECRFLQDLSVEETAEILGRSSVAIRILQHRALKRLKTLSQHLYENL